MTSSKTTIHKVLDGLPLTPDEGLELYLNAETSTLGLLADEVRRAKHPPEEEGEVVTYIIDRNINPTNVCVTDCGFCAFYRRPGDPESYILNEESYFEKVQELVNAGGTQILVQGGHHPYLRTEWFEELFQKTKERFPGIWIHGMSPPEIVHLSKLDRIPVREVLSRLQAAGLDSLPGGGAEILVERVREIIAPKKATTEEWLDVMRQLASLGMRGTATMMFGHVETPKERIEHLLRIRELQEECGVFTAFIPWTFQPDHTPQGEEWLAGRPKATAHEYLRMLALSRIFLHNIDNIQSSWVTQGIKTCQIGLAMGANDFGSAMLEENVVSSAGCDNMTSVLEIERHIKDAGFVPRRRNMLYQLLDENNQPMGGRVMQDAPTGKEAGR
ncbi:MAG TPA: dehypoxanthine futalosine cyclase [Planctomycetes bacterium]|nr:dehypoxanthine futalosine cyclase [Planctomycetota bacterium]